MIPAAKFGAAEEAQEALVLTDEEKKIEQQIFVSLVSPLLVTCRVLVSIQGCHIK